jgi:hypothetical protein
MTRSARRRAPRRLLAAPWIRSPDHAAGARHRIRRGARRPRDGPAAPPPPLGRWLQPGGHVEPGERPRTQRCARPSRRPGRRSATRTTGRSSCTSTSIPGRTDTSTSTCATCCSPTGLHRTDAGESTGDGPGATLRWATTRSAARSRTARSPGGRRRSGTARRTQGARERPRCGQSAKSRGASSSSPRSARGRPRPSRSRATPRAPGPAASRTVAARMPRTGASSGSRCMRSR